jgi:hypothetical protein
MSEIKLGRTDRMSKFKQINIPDHVLDYASNIMSEVSMDGKLANKLSLIQQREWYLKDLKSNIKNKRKGCKCYTRPYNQKWIETFVYSHTENRVQGYSHNRKYHPQFHMEHEDWWSDTWITTCVMIALGEYQIPRTRDEVLRVMNVGGNDVNLFLKYIKVNSDFKLKPVLPKMWLSRALDCKKLEIRPKEREIAQELLDRVQGNYNYGDGFTHGIIPQVIACACVYIAGLTMDEEQRGITAKRSGILQREFYKMGVFETNVSKKAKEIMKHWKPEISDKLDYRKIVAEQTKLKGYLIAKVENVLESMSKIEGVQHHEKALKNLIGDLSK